MNPSAMSDRILVVVVMVLGTTLAINGAMRMTQCTQTVGLAPTQSQQKRTGMSSRTTPSLHTYNNATRGGWVWYFSSPPPSCSSLGPTCWLFGDATLVNKTTMGNCPEGLAFVQEQCLQKRMREHTIWSEEFVSQAEQEHNLEMCTRSVPVLPPPLPGWRIWSQSTTGGQAKRLPGADSGTRTPFLHQHWTRDGETSVW